jgi:copper chaperone NosL
MTRRAFVALTLAGGSACGAAADGPPQIEVDRTACSHCGMLVSEPVYAAAYRAPGVDPRVFDDIKCLADAARKEPDLASLRFWFHDAASAVWIDGHDAVFVASPSLRTPMGGGLVAYRDRAAARRAALSQHGHVIESVGELLRSTTEGGGREAR